MPWRLELLAARGKGFLFAFATVLPILNPPAAAPIFLRLSAFILLCLGVQIVWSGVHELVPALLREAGG